ncbi:hypothetical protein D3871_26750 [Noviherbaspirillum saxi]|uniref:Recombinase-like domain-containing protein n=2 Tax=Noviherbaspirillum saxi TaxID=2320863 RepID=A0A3A3FI25_9BURK|nr:hypothetical protein D3871_26750 [Noviherbaspirillum saxi]
MQELYLNPHQARRRQPTAYEDLLGDSIERAYAAGVHDLAGLVAHLNRTGPNCPAGGVWTEDSYRAEIARLAAEC